jgi:hypothetical protein
VLAPLLQEVRVRLCLLQDFESRFSGVGDAVPLRGRLQRLACRVGRQRTDLWKLEQSLGL